MSDTTSPQIVPYLYYEDATAAVEFMVDVFGFSVEHAIRHPETDAVLHASVRTGSGMLFVGPGMDAFGTRGNPDPEHVSSMTYVYVDDVRGHYERVCGSGAVIRQELHEHLGGNLQYTVSDPGGQRFTFATPLEDTPA